jgi:UDP-N-acetylmuramate-alanine ligase
VDADYMIGGQLQGFDEMVKLTKTAKYMIFEGDEFPTSPLDSRSKFLHYHPHIAVISGIAWDHVDVFPDYENYIDTFCLFLQDINSEGCLIYNHDDQELMRLSKEINARKIAYFPHQYKTEQGITIISDNAENDYPLNIFGLHNMANLSAARLVCKELGVSDEVFYTAISGFQGASLRMELLATKGKSFIYRDFAHSAPELKAAVHALRQQYPEHRLIISYELQCYSSMSELYIDHYSGTLDLADEAIVFYDPKSANNKKIPLMTNGRIKQGFSRMDLHLFSESADMLKYLKTLTKDNFVLGFLTCGRYGGIDIPAVAMEFIESLKS